MSDSEESQPGARPADERRPLATAYHQLRKADLETLLKKLHLDHTGTVDVLRQRLATCLNRPDPEVEINTTDLRNVENPLNQGDTDEAASETQYDDTAESLYEAPANGPPVRGARAASGDNTVDTAGVCERVRKCGIIFDGRSDPVLFLERLDEFQECYNLPRRHLLAALPVMLKGNALLWYRNAKDAWYSWQDFVDEFRLQFLPLRYQYHLEEAIRKRTQGAEEKFKDYAIALQTLLRRASSCSPEEKLERIYNNMLPNYKLYVRRCTVSTLPQLTAAALEYEQILEDRKKAPSSSNNQHFYTEERRNQQANVPSGPRVPPRNNNVPASSRNMRQQPAAAPARKIELHADTCWKCGERGHGRSRCPNRAVTFCSRCGKTGILTKDCCGFQGN